MTEERPTDWIAEIAQLLPCAMRALFAPPPEQSPLWDLPPPQMRTLFRLRNGGDLTMNEVARSLGVAMSTATQLADRLERLGLVERKADPADRRVVRLSLTELGHTALAEHTRERDARIGVAMQQLTPAEREAVLNGLRLLETAARQCEPAPNPAGRHQFWEMVTASMPPASARHND
jgi:DNA-binding MarR family transcriptional regulator